MALSFGTSYEPLSANDFRSEKRYAKILANIGDNDILVDSFYETLNSSGHKIGGYPFFTQEDPRAYGDYKDSTILLLQIDSKGKHIVWGMTGLAISSSLKMTLNERILVKFYIIGIAINRRWNRKSKWI